MKKATEIDSKKQSDYLAEQLAQILIQQVIYTNNQIKIKNGQLSR